MEPVLNSVSQSTCMLNHSGLTLCDPWTVAPLSMEFSRQEYWNGWLPFPPPGDFPDLGLELIFLASLALADGFSSTVPPRVVFWHLGD